jgi:hypothetical protein
MTMNRFSCILIVFLCFLLFVPAVHAKEIKTFEDTKAKISLGYFLPRMNTEVRLDPANPAPGDGDHIDVEDELGLDKDLFLARLDGYYRLGRKHRLQFGYFTFKRDAVRAIDQELTYGDHTFEVNARVESDIENSIAVLGYMYSLHQTDRFEVSGTFGIHRLAIKTKLKGDTTGGSIESSDTNAKGPLPLIGIDLDYAITPRWIVSFRGMFFSVELDTFSGRLTDFKGSLEYFFLNNLGVGFGINRFDMKVDYSDDGREADFSWGYNGLQLYLTARL